MIFDHSLPIRERIQKRRTLLKIRLAAAWLTAASILIVFASAYSAVQSLDSVKTVSKPAATAPANAETAALVPEKNNTDMQTQELTPKLQKLKAQLEAYLEDRSGHFGVSFLSLESGETFGINESEEFTAASTIKIPISLLLVHQIRQGELRADAKLTYNREDFEEGTGEIRWTASYGESFTIKELCRQMIVSSDNIATNMLLRQLGIHALKEFMRESGGITVKEDENVTCPADLTKYLKMLHTYSRNQQGMGQELLSWYESTEFNERLPLLLPGSIKIAHKTGDQENNLAHDAGIIFADEPYILSVMSKNAPREESYQTIAKISKIVYDAMLTP